APAPAVTAPAAWVRQHTAQSATSTLTPADGAVSLVRCTGSAFPDRDCEADGVIAKASAVCMRHDPISQLWRCPMSYLCNVRRRSFVITAIHLLAAIDLGGSVAAGSAQEIARLAIVTGGASHVSSSPIISNNSLAPIRLAHAPTGRPLEKITFLLDFTPYGKHAPFFAALDKGFWKDAGFDVTIVKGEGSATTISSYAAGAVDFAFSDTPTLILARSKGALVKVAGVIPTNRSMPSERWRKTTSRRRRISKASESARASVTQAA